MVRILINSDYTALSHAMISTIVFLDRIITLSSKKSKTIHKLSGKVFFFWNVV